jgi:hypothetical protein
MRAPSPSFAGRFLGCNGLVHRCAPIISFFCRDDSVSFAVLGDKKVGNFPSLRSSWKYHLDTVRVPLAALQGSLVVGCVDQQVSPAVGLCLRTAKHGHKSVPAHSGGVCAFFDEVEKRKHPTPKGGCKGTWFPHTPH